MATGHACALTPPPPPFCCFPARCGEAVAAHVRAWRWNIRRQGEEDIMEYSVERGVSDKMHVITLQVVNMDEHIQPSLTEVNVMTMNQQGVEIIPSELRQALSSEGEIMHTLPLPEGVQVFKVGPNGEMQYIERMELDAAHTPEEYIGTVIEQYHDPLVKKEKRSLQCDVQIGNNTDVTIHHCRDRQLEGLQSGVAVEKTTSSATTAGLNKTKKQGRIQPDSLGHPMFERRSFNGNFWE
ncbi:hypothetical protein chiPu_0019139 [Chiloscyllium punctatum]|uniref:Uncharacterized protein n=1 Tax=Chiloscyllium punctatum TaxID=137246 RepID=A0A401RQX6_CHIPU|nr:hypothetical protein [Chiloscyllium punctatum]